MRIAFLYMDVTNLGDLVIRDTSRYVLDSILSRNGLGDCEVVEVDIGGRRCREAYSSPLDRVVDKLMGKFRRLATRRTFYAAFPGLAEKMLLWAWRRSSGGRYFKRHEMPKLVGCDLILFGGGGLVKYHRQSFHYVIHEVCAFATAHDVPVLISAVGIEGYDGEHPGCKILKRALNESCVKYISARDDYRCLRDDYIVNDGIVVKEVCDPAFWTVEAYGVKRRTAASGVIGINVIRPAIFGAYLYKVDTDELDEMYHELIGMLTAQGHVVDLFSNGVPGDTNYISSLLEKYPDLAGSDSVTVSTPETPRELVELIAGYDRFLAVRLHASIVGTVLGIPNVSLVWNVKQILFGKRVGKPENYLVLEDFKAATVYGRLEAATPYVMDENYKNSVRDSLEPELMRYLAPPDAEGKMLHGA